MNLRQRKPSVKSDLKFPVLRKVPMKPKISYTQSDQVYNVHKIIGERKKDGVSEVLTSWKQHPGWNTWEPVAHMQSSANLLIEDFRRKTPIFDAPSDDLKHFSLSTLALAMQRALHGENSGDTVVAFPEAVFRPRDICETCSKQVNRIFCYDTIGNVSLPEPPEWLAHSEGCSICEKKTPARGRPRKAVAEEKKLWYTPRQLIPCLSPTFMPACFAYYGVLQRKKSQPGVPPVLKTPEAVRGSQPSKKAAGQSPADRQSKSVVFKTPEAESSSQSSKRAASQSPAVRQSKCRTSQDILKRVIPGTEQELVAVTPFKNTKEYHDMGRTRQWEMKDVMSQNFEDMLGTALKTTGLEPYELKLKAKDGKFVNVRFRAAERDDCTTMAYKCISLLSRVPTDALRDITHLFDDCPSVEQIKLARDALLQTLPPIKSLSDHPLMETKLEGAEIDFELLLMFYMEKYVRDACLSEEAARQQWEVKLSGDGTVPQRSDPWTISSFTIYHATADGAIGTYAYNMLRAGENLSLLRVGLHGAIIKIKQIMAIGGVIIRIRHKPIFVPVSIILGADYKFLRISLGMKSSIGNHPCIYCTLGRDAPFADNVRDNNIYELAENLRTADSMKDDLAQQKHDQDSKPLIWIEPSMVIIDELHMRIRVHENMCKRLAFEAVQKDASENFKGKYNEGPNFQAFTATLREIHPGFKCSIGAKLENWTDYVIGRTVGHHWKLISAKLPDALENCTFLFDYTKKDIAQLWKQTRDLFSTISAAKPTQAEIANYYARAMAWLSTYNSLTLNKKEARYQAKDLSPYMHSMIFHNQSMLQRFGSLKKYNCESVEFLNAKLKRTLQRTNQFNRMHDCLRWHHSDILCQPFRREKRAYRKLYEEYWIDNAYSASILKQTRRDQAKNAVSKKSAGLLELPAPEEMDAADAREELRCFLNCDTQAKSLKALLEKLKKARALKLESKRSLEV